MKYDKSLPMYYQIQPINEDGSETVTPKTCATMIGCINYLEANGLKKGVVNSVQKFDGQWIAVTGKAKAIINNKVVEI